MAMEYLNKKMKTGLINALLAGAFASLATGNIWAGLTLFFALASMACCIAYWIEKKEPNKDP